MGNIVIIGFPRAGKTHFGRCLAEKENLPFIDTDARIEMKMGLSVRRLHGLVGEELFREIEHLTLHEIHGPAIIATGGGVVMRWENIELLKKMGPIFYFRQPKELIRQRLLTPPRPSFLEGGDMESRFEELYKLREPLYYKAATEVVDGKQ
ncbi:MAG: shikimate kinase [Simkaniaceae bacterium]|nr:shikimate kinase [Simkaniaceae bacterium]